MNFEVFSFLGLIPVFNDVVTTRSNPKGNKFLALKVRSNRDYPLATFILRREKLYGLMQLNASYTSAPYLTSYQTFFVVKPFAITVWNQYETAQTGYDFFSLKSYVPNMKLIWKENCRLSRQSKTNLYFRLPCLQRNQLTGTAINILVVFNRFKSVVNETRIVSKLKTLGRKVYSSSDE